MRPRLLLAVAGSAALLFSCDDKTKGLPRPAASVAPASPSSVAEALGIDAGAFVDTADPPPPAGDLKADLDRFVNVETCVKERANLDPLVGDGLRAIGYDTFLRDACRLLEAAKDKKRETCDRIDSSPMRARCQSWVAIVAQTPDACPLQFEGVATRGRNVTCLAVAGKDPRLCAGEPRTATRATCEALASRDEAKCDVLIPPDRPGCKREVARWRSLLAPPLTGMPALAASRGKLSVKGDSGTADPPTSEADLASELARGGVVVTSRERARVELGMIGESETSRIAPSPNRRPRLGLAVLLEPGTTPKDPQKALLERLELEIPGEATLVYPGVRCECRVTTSRVERTRGGEIALALQGTISAGSRSYKIDVDLATFVRDVVSEQTVIGGAARVLPPLHPTLPSSPIGDAGARDAGRR
ncbi:MAG TPA: hypothetical protein VLT33_01725 [Labilithrix sp.]|nr:hypothetical protein [Labilithrix sp.]